MLALCSMLWHTYYAWNYAGIIGASLLSAGWSRKLIWLLVSWTRPYFFAGRLSIGDYKRNLQSLSALRRNRVWFTRLSDYLVVGFLSVGLSWIENSSTASLTPIHPQIYTNTNKFELIPVLSRVLFTCSLGFLARLNKQRLLYAYKRHKLSTAN